jgi:hypothetical protein
MSPPSRKNGVNGFQVFENIIMQHISPSARATPSIETMRQLVVSLQNQAEHLSILITQMEGDTKEEQDRELLIYHQ